MKKLVALVLIVCLAVGCLSVLTACNKDKDKSKENKEPVDYSKLNVLFLGDSIAEAVAGPSPIEEREWYGYYGLIGQINGYNYNNRAISGHQTGELLAYISREEENAYLTNTLIADADVICISITGNDLLWHNFPLMLYELAAKEKYGADYVNREDVAACYEYHRYQVINEEGTMRTITKDDDLTAGEWRALKPGDGIATFERCVATATKNVGDIVAKLREKNPKATIIFQNVYNPVDNESELIPINLVEDLMKLDAKYDFSTASGVAEYRRWGKYMLGAMSDILENAAENNDKVEFLDVAKAFDEVYEADKEQGKALIFDDGVHPSDQGHAKIAATMEAKLVELGLADGKAALANYKELRKTQLGRQYGEVAGFDLAAARAAVDAAEDMDGVSRAFFDATSNYTPKLLSDPVTTIVTNGVHVAETERYNLTRVINRKADEAGQAQLDGIFEIADLYVTEKYLELNADGTMEIKIVAPVGDLLPLLTLVGTEIDGMVLGGKEDTFYKDENGNLTNLMMSGAKDTYGTLKVYADALFPGLGWADGTFGANFHYMYDSLGLGIEGLEVLTDVPYTDTVGLPANMAPEGTIDQSTVGKTYASYADYLLAYLGRYQEVVDADGKTLHVDKLPAGVMDKLMELGNVTIRVNTKYSLVDLTGADGKTYQAVYCGNYSAKTSPWLILTKYADEEGTTHVRFDFEIMGFILQF